MRRPTNGGTQPMWRRDGEELFYLALDNTLMAELFRPGSTTAGGAPIPGNQLSIVLNWRAKVNARPHTETHRRLPWKQRHS